MNVAAGSKYLGFGGFMVLIFVFSRRMSECLAQGLSWYFGDFGFDWSQRRGKRVRDLRQTNTPQALETAIRKDFTRCLNRYCLVDF